MSLTEMKTEAESLTEQERQELIAYLLKLGDGQDAEYRQQIADKIDSDDFVHWKDVRGEFIKD